MSECGPDRVEPDWAVPLTPLFPSSQGASACALGMEGELRLKGGTGGPRTALGGAVKTGLRPAQRSMVGLL